jgi:hypothetical protein
MANTIAIVLILAICFAAGLAARSSMFSKRVARVDNILTGVMPGYAVARGIVGGVAGKEDATSVLSPVLVQFDDYEQIAFEVERNGLYHRPAKAPVAHLVQKWHNIFASPNILPSRRRGAIAMRRCIPTLAGKPKSQ